MTRATVIRETVYPRRVGNWRLVMLWLPEQGRYVTGLWLGNTGYVVESTRWGWVASICYFVGRLVYDHTRALADGSGSRIVKDFALRENP